MSDNDTVVYVDMDETLLHGYSVGDRRYIAQDNGSFETAKLDNEDYLIILRPFAKKFLQAMNKITPNVFILTAGRSDFQTRVAQKIGILPLTRGLYGRDSKNVPKFRIPLLVDDLGIRMGLTYRKFHQMGVLTDDEFMTSQQTALSREELIAQEKRLADYYLLVKPFTAEHADDRVLVDAVPEVHRKLDIIKKSLDKSGIQDKIAEKFIK